MTDCHSECRPTSRTTVPAAGFSPLVDYTGSRSNHRIGLDTARGFNISPVHLCRAGVCRLEHVDRRGSRRVTVRRCVRSRGVRFKERVRCPIPLRRAQFPRVRLVALHGTCMMTAGASSVTPQSARRGVVPKIRSRNRSGDASVAATRAFGKQKPLQMKRSLSVIPTSSTPCERWL